MVWWVLTNIYSHINHHHNQNMEYFYHPKKFPQFKFVGANCRQAFPSNKENGTICLFSFLALYIIASLTLCPTAGSWKSQGDLRVLTHQFKGKDGIVSGSPQEGVLQIQTFGWDGQTEGDLRIPSSMDAFPWAEVPMNSFKYADIPTEVPSSLIPLITGVWT